MRVRSVLLASLAILLPLLLFRSIHFSASFGLSDAAAWLDGERRLDQHATVRILDDDVHAPVPATAPPVTAPPTMTASPPPPGASTAAPTTAAATNASLHNATLAAMARSNLVYNRPGYALLGALEPARVGTTLHFTFGSIVMRDFVRNWMHAIRKAKLAPALVGCADASLLRELEAEGVAAVGVQPELDVWTYTRKARAKEAVFDLKSDWKYYRHHKSSFLEMGLVKAAFLWELLLMKYDVLISDLDVVWLNGHWARWMSYANPKEPPLPQASLIAMADVLVSTDEINAAHDGPGGWGFNSELNTGVLFFRCTKGSLAAVQAWRSAMMRMRDGEFLNDQGIFNNMVHGAGLRRVSDNLGAWKEKIKRGGGYVSEAGLASATSETREVWLSRPSFRPCLPDDDCASVPFSLGTLPMRGFTNGHTWFNQDVAHMPGAERPEHAPVTVHFTFQFGDTNEYPHGKRQRAREAALWSVDPPEYFTEGVFVRVLGDLYTPAQRADAEKKFPDWSPVRHMTMDAPQRAAVRDLLALATAIDGIMIMPRLHCFCDRYWNFLSRCRFPIGPRDMPIPWTCPQDALYDVQRWNKKKVRFREAAFLENLPEAGHIGVLAKLKANTVRVRVPPPGAAAANGSAAPGEVVVPSGSPLTAVASAVRAANAEVRMVEIHIDDLRRLCRWLGSTQKNQEFNSLIKYILTESSRYCPSEDHHGFGGWNWRNPFTAYNCTWGFHYPALYPLKEPCAAPGAPPPPFAERPNSTTCPRQMLCSWHTQPDGRETGKITFCNIEGGWGEDPRYHGPAKHMLSQMPDQRCPYPDGVTPGGGRGLDRAGHWVGA